MTAAGLLTAPPELSAIAATFYQCCADSQLCGPCVIGTTEAERDSAVVAAMQLLEDEERAGARVRHCSDRDESGMVQIG